MFPGEKEVVTTLVRCSAPEVHARHHEPEKATVIAAKMRSEMIQLVKENPVGPVSRKRDNVVLKYKAMYADSDPDLWR